MMMKINSKVCIIPAMTSTSEKTQPLEIETTSTPRPGIWSFRVTTINDSWTEASIVQTTFKCEVMAKQFPLCSTIHVRLTALQFPTEFFQPTRTFQLATQEIVLA